jgi:hypothetical protein
MERNIIAIVLQITKNVTPYRKVTYTHSTKDNGKVIFMHIQHIFALFLNQTSLTTNLGGQLQEFRKEKKEIFQDRTDKEGI